MAACKTEREQSTTRCRPLSSRRISAYHRDFDFTGVAEGGAWNFRSTELEDGVERKRGTLFARRRGVGEIAGWARGREANAAISADGESWRRLIQTPYNLIRIL